MYTNAIAFLVGGIIGGCVGLAILRYLILRRP